MFAALVDGSDQIVVALVALDLIVPLPSSCAALSGDLIEGSAEREAAVGTSSAPPVTDSSQFGVI